MENNVGRTSIILPRIIGENLDFDNPIELLSITVLTGELGLGFLLFDENGTMSTCTKISTDAEENPIYTFTTQTLNTEIDILNILSKSY